MHSEGFWKHNSKEFVQSWLRTMLLTSAIQFSFTTKITSTITVGTFWLISYKEGPWNSHISDSSYNLSLIQTTSGWNFAEGHWKFMEILGFPTEDQTWELQCRPHFVTIWIWTNSNVLFWLNKTQLCGV